MTLKKEEIFKHSSNYSQSVISLKRRWHWKTPEEGEGCFTSVVFDDEAIYAANGTEQVWMLRSDSKRPIGLKATINNNSVIINYIAKCTRDKNLVVWTLKEEVDPNSTIGYWSESAQKMKVKKGTIQSGTTKLGYWDKVSGQITQIKTEKSPYEVAWSSATSGIVYTVHGDSIRVIHDGRDVELLKGFYNDLVLSSDGSKALARQISRENPSGGGTLVLVDLAAKDKKVLQEKTRFRPIGFNYDNKIFVDAPTGYNSHMKRKYRGGVFKLLKDFSFEIVLEHPTGGSAFARVEGTRFFQDMGWKSWRMSELGEFSLP